MVWGVGRHARDVQASQASRSNPPPKQPSLPNLLPQVILCAFNVVLLALSITNWRKRRAASAAAEAKDAAAASGGGGALAGKAAAAAASPGAGLLKRRGGGRAGVALQAQALAGGRVLAR